MKQLMKTIVPVAVLSLGFVVNANAQDAQELMQSTVSKKVVNYQCAAKKKVKVTYGFNKQGLPTYAQALLNGKTRNMPINLNRSDNVELVFGDENNFSLSTSAFDSKTYRSKPILIMSPSSEILFKNCSPKR